VNNFTPEITELISEPDNVEKIRDRLGAIVKGETGNQYRLAIDKGASDAEDFNFRVYIENARPYDTGEDPLVSPIVNIMLSKVVSMDGNSRMGNQKEKATFLIDCICFGNDSGDEWDDKAATLRAWKAARVVRSILMSEPYTYLGLRGVVGSRLVISIEAGTPDVAEAALAVVTARITLDVQFLERGLVTQGPIIEAISFTIDPSSGEVLANQ
jgi:hypothetical protein